MVFDMDGVLVQLDRDKRNRCLAGFTGRMPEHFDATIWHSDFERRAEAGEFPTAADYLAEFNRRSGCRLGREEWIEARRQAMALIPGTLEIVGKLRRVADVAVLTNNGALLGECLPELVPEICGAFGGAVHASCEFRARKPDRQVFERILARYAVTADRAILVDDDLSNFQGAKDAGMGAILFEHPAGLRACLSELGLDLQP
ncbi:MAG TPA: HAD-IA family hydrolase [Holophaga sp.]|nr:HAD-IA family hydrolase [Holophaga sp.]